MISSEPRNHHEGEGTDESYAEPCKYLGQRVLSENHSCRSDYSRQNQKYAEEKYRIEIEEQTKCNQSSDKTSHTDHVSGYFPPCIDRHTDNLRHEGGEDDATDKHRHIEFGHYHKTSTIAAYRHDVREVSVLPV